MLRKLLPLCLLACALAPAAAQASPNNLSIMMDDDLLLYRGAATRDQTLHRMRSLGVDTVRASVLWSVVAEDAKQGKRARRFRGENPKTYPSANWDRYDQLARSCVTLKVACYFDVTPPGPDWAHGKAPRKERRNQKTWEPKVREFARFVTAVGRRYSGAYRDENEGRGMLPRVSFWAIGNEPNQQGWLTPQWARKGNVRYNAAAKQYRELWRHGRKALDRTGHGKDTILLGETAPLGSTRRGSQSPTHPKTFIRELFCVDASGKRFSGKAASVRGCSRLPDFNATAFAHHAYTKTLSPAQRDPNRDSITMANIGELGQLLDQVGKATGKLRAGMPTMITEFGYETNPPDPFSKISPAQQAQYINEGDYIAYKDPRIQANTQFLLRDVLPQKRYRVGSKQYWFTYQSGLFDPAGKPKPAALAYTLPFVITGKATAPDGRQVLGFWGQLRFVGNGVPSAAQLQFRPAGQAAWQPSGEPFPVSNAKNFWEQQRIAPGPGSWRVVWSGAGQTFTSREIVAP